MAKDDTREVSYKGQSIDFGFYGKSLKGFKQKGDIKSSFSKDGAGKENEVRG